MLEIKPCLEVQPVAAFCRASGRVYSGAFFIYQAMNRGEELGAALFEMQGDRIEAVAYRTTQPEDHWLLDGVLRAGLNYAAEHGIINGVLGVGFLESAYSLLEKLNLPRSSVFNIHNFFSKYKNCEL
ncbi:hypothetical protein U6B65_10850 [Oscillospiraceae bacterium MB08-C2-2]|nr:hypothetical protein U6B65_10850 [Oscillospiraceae bacterium MB08-C2-2]